MSNNDAPNRQQLIERAFDAVIEVAFDGDMERARNTVPPREGRFIAAMNEGAGVAAEFSRVSALRRRGAHGRLPGG